nr:MAG TPA: hypothetical protein [Caudoviricetes sp.]
MNSLLLNDFENDICFILFEFRLWQFFILLVNLRIKMFCIECENESNCNW